MKPGLLFSVLVALSAQAFPGLAADGEDDQGNFELQAERLYQALQTQCREPFHLLPPDDFSGAMFRCTNGSASFVAIAAKPPATENLNTIRVSWNDLFNTASGARYVHADRGAALFFVTAAATLYAPDLVDEVLAAFEQDENRTWDAGPISITYSYFRATLSDERVLTIQPSGL